MVNNPKLQLHVLIGVGLLAIIKPVNIFADLANNLVFIRCFGHCLCDGIYV